MMTKRIVVLLSVLSYIAIESTAQQVEATGRLVEHQPTMTQTIDGESFDISAYQSMELDGIINQYMENDDAQGQVFWLEGDKNYHITANIALYKGMTLATQPQDAAKGRRATLFLNGLSQKEVLGDGGVLRERQSHTATFFLGRQAREGEEPATVLSIDGIHFADLDIRVPLAYNSGHTAEGIGRCSGNYFINMFADGLETDARLIEWRNCSFQGLIRGFFRVQGSRDCHVSQIRLEGCEFYNCGYYDALSSSGSYGYIFADLNQKPKSNVLADVEVAECTFYNSPLGTLVSDNGRNVNWDESVRWTINVHHNTFVNFYTASPRFSLMRTDYIPGGSTLAFHDNLILLTKDVADTQRPMFSGGWKTKTCQGGDGSGRCTFNVYNNWTTNDEAYFVGGQPFTDYAFTATANAPGMWIATWGDTGFPYGADELKVHIDANLQATDLMASPAPKHFISEEMPSPQDYHTDDLGGLYYQDTEAVRNSAIVRQQAGAAKWRNGVQAPSGIADTHVTPSDENRRSNMIFNLKGQQTERIPQKGIYIKNNKKYVK